MHGMGRKILVAGVGNVLRGDDGFGVEVATRLIQKDNLPASVKVIETGIGGMSLVQEMMYGYEALVLIDAYEKGGKPGQLYLLEPTIPDLSHLNPHDRRDYFADTHYATPIRALALVDHVATLPKTIRIIGCEPEQLDELRIGLSTSVSAAIDGAVAMVVDWVREYQEHDMVEWQCQGKIA